MFFCWRNELNTIIHSIKILSQEYFLKCFVVKMVINVSMALGFVVISLRKGWQTKPIIYSSQVLFWETDILVRHVSVFIYWSESILLLTWYTVAGLSVGFWVAGSIQKVGRLFSFYFSSIMLWTVVLTFWIAAAVFGIAGGMRRLSAYFDNPAVDGFLSRLIDASQGFINKCFKPPWISKLSKSDSNLVFFLWM